MKWYVQAELVHARFAMAGVAGILFTDVGSFLIFCNHYYCIFVYMLDVATWVGRTGWPVDHSVDKGHFLLQLLRVTGISDLPVWYEAGATKFDFASTRTLFIIQLLLMG